MANGTFVLPPIVNLDPAEIKNVGFNADISLFLTAGHGRLFSIDVTLTDSAVAQAGYKLFQVVFSKNKVQMYGQKPDGSWETFGTIT